MNLECPGCRTRLKVDPSRLPAGATTAICPKCRTKILLPGSASAGSEISVQCPHCSSRLKVNVARLKPGLSQSRCPKCGGSVDLPAAPAATPSRPPEPIPISEKTRRIDPREMGLILGPKGAGPAPVPGSAPQPLSIEERFEVSDLDLGRLIDDKVHKLGEESGPRAAAAPPEAPPPPSREASPAPVAAPPGAFAPAGPAPGPASGSRPPVSSRSGDRLRRSDSGISPGASPTFSAALTARRAPAGPFLIGGAVGGAVIGTLAVGLGDLLPRYLAAVGVLPPSVGDVLPRYMLAPVPGWLVAALGERVGRVVLLIVLSTAGSWLGGVVFAPRPRRGARAQGPPRGLTARIALVSALIGALAGASVCLSEGALSLDTVIDWTLDLALSGLLAGLVARAAAPRP